MRIYMDVSCLGRPFDDLTVERNHREAIAVRTILEKFDRGKWTHISSEIAKMEIDAIPDAKRRRYTQLLLPETPNRIMLDEAIGRRATELMTLGIRPADALHVASSEFGRARVMLTCDDRLLKKAQRHRELLKIRAANPLIWLRETHHAQDD